LQLSPARFAPSIMFRAALLRVRVFTYLEKYVTFARMLVPLRLTNIKQRSETGVAPPGLCHLSKANPPLPRWARLFRASGAGPSHYSEHSQSCMWSFPRTCLDSKNPSQPTAPDSFTPLHGERGQS
jgi:hypothetical protein